MRYLLIFLISLLCYHLSSTQSEQAIMIEISDLEGKWFINKSNFPMWLKGDKTAPNLNYSVIVRKGQTILLDQVLYTKNGKEKGINGIDKILNHENSEFIWRGKGILKPVTSKWKILAISPDKTWAIIYFEKSLFTPKGYDIISRRKTLSQTMEDDVKSKLMELGIKDSLTSIEQN